MNNWRRSNLSSGALLFVGAHVNAHDIISVMLGVSGNILGCAVNFTTSEESLGVGVRVKNDSKSSSEVANLLIFVEVDVLS